MDYSALIQERKSTRAFTDIPVPADKVAELVSYYKCNAKRLCEDLATDLILFDEDKKEALEGTAGYKEFMIGAPKYAVLLSEKGDAAVLNGGYLMEDLILKLTDMDLATCWITFTDSDKVKAALDINSDKDVVAIVAFGYGQKAKKRLRLNILSMSNIDTAAKRQFQHPKKAVEQLAYLDEWGNKTGVAEYIGFYDDILYEALYAASLSPSYLNLQPYGFLIHDNAISLVAEDEPNTPSHDAALNLGIVMLHFEVEAEKYVHDLKWTLGAGNVAVPDNCQVVATCNI